ncbi:hypothetical protein AB0N50_37700 [Streptomyces pharetrae]|uniref:hypothetical protein n=1 Tax=Streptomyces pharetrae TaxID=291370 RepID=UPI003460FFAA
MHDDGRADVRAPGRAGESGPGLSRLPAAAARLLLQRRYLVGIDVNLAFGAAANGAVVGLASPPVHVTDPVFDAALPGSYIDAAVAQLRAAGHDLDVPFEETVSRHATKPIADDVSEAQLRDWYRSRDLLPGQVETVIGADSTLAATVDRIMLDTDLAGLPAMDR